MQAITAHFGDKTLILINDYIYQSFQSSSSFKAKLPIFTARLYNNSRHVTAPYTLSLKKPDP